MRIKRPKIYHKKRICITIDKDLITEIRKYELNFVLSNFINDVLKDHLIFLQRQEELQALKNGINDLND